MAAIEELDFIHEIAQVCEDGAAFGWHEANGGNLSMRLTDDQVRACERGFSLKGEGHEWYQLREAHPALAHTHLLVTRSGSYLRLVPQRLSKNLGIIEFNSAGDAWRKVWGFSQNGHPTSELAAHALIHAQCDRPSTVYHAHTPHAVALSHLVGADEARWNELLRTATTEFAGCLPEGVAVLPLMQPGSLELGQATAEALAAGRQACVWAHHGSIAVAASPARAFGAIHTVEKAAQIAVLARLHQA